MNLVVIPTEKMWLRRRAKASRYNQEAFFKKAHYDFLHDPGYVCQYGQNAGRKMENASTT
jgi:hypothetical protein